MSSAQASTSTLLDVRDLSVRFRTRDGVVQAVSNLSFTLRRGETLGVVGESGSGKTTVARCIARLIAPSAGAILIEDADVAQLGTRALRPHRKRVQVGFQDPLACLHPMDRVGFQLA